MYDSSIHERSEFSTVLREENVSLLAALEDLLFDENSTPAHMRAAWQAFEAALHGHMAVEEEVLIPRFELVRPADVARIRGEHRQMREQLSALAADFARGVVDRERLARLLGVLRVSAALKDGDLYAWAEQSLRPRDKVRVIESVRAKCLACQEDSASLTA